LRSCPQRSFIAGRLIPRGGRPLSSILRRWMQGPGRTFRKSVEKIQAKTQLPNWMLRKLFGNEAESVRLT
jgi:hypothetical protein